MAKDLSVLIPARNEMWLAKTCEDVLAKLEADTEIIVVLDGEWANPPLPSHPRLKVVYLPEPIGQRAATNLAAKLSHAKYIMKLDAHCAMDQGFDAKLIQAASELGETVTQVPVQHNLHVFDWVCEEGHRRYQGPSGPCVQCGKDMSREIVWNAIRRRTEHWRFDSNLHFQYWGERKNGAKARSEGDFTETLSMLGACWFMSKARYEFLEGLDEAHGSWGQMGTEISCKSWLSGGRVVTNRRTWFSHMFRTQGGDFSFPYEMKGSDQQHAQKYSQDLWRGNKWPKQVKSLKWLVEHFWPVPGWTESERDRLPDMEPRTNLVSDTSAVPNRLATAGIIYYSDGKPDPLILRAVQKTIEASELPIVAVTLRPIQWSSATNIVLDLERGYLTMFKQILAGLEALDTDFVFFCEHDVLYHESHFNFVPPRDDIYYYNLNFWKVDASSGHAIAYDAKQTSGLCGNRLLLIKHYKERIRRVELEGFSRKMGFEPGSHRRAERVDNVGSEVWRAPFANLDIRHKSNLTQSRWKQEQFRDQRNCQNWQEADEIPGWGRVKGQVTELLEGVCNASVV